MVRSREYTKQAFRLIDRVSEYERAGMAGRYYGVTGEVYKEIDAWQLSVRNYPRRWEVHNALGLVYIDYGQYEGGAEGGAESSSVAAKRGTALSTAIGRLHVSGSA